MGLGGLVRRAEAVSVSYLPVVRALRERPTLGVRMPNFTSVLPFRVAGYPAESNRFTILPGA